VRRQTLSRLLFPGPAEEYADHLSRYGDTAIVPTGAFFYGLDPETEVRIDFEPGVSMLLELESISAPDENGMRSVICMLNGQLRPTQVRDRAIAATRPATVKADTGEPGQVAAPFAGVVTVDVGVGEKVEAGATVAHIEAMKMEAAITTPVAGTVARIAVPEVGNVEGGDLLVEVRP